MDKRSYNIYFHLHTVTGIVISVLLYVIFFAGSFSFFRDAVIAWERNESVSEHSAPLNFNAALDTLDKRYRLATRDVSLNKPVGEARLAVSISAPKDTLLGNDSYFFYLDPKTYQTHTYEKSYSLGEFLYRLHFFAQIPYPAGYYLSGFTALFFLFAVLTGILVHWKKIVSNFYLFRPWEKLKTVWTDAHTALGTIGLPFQAIYAVTGAFFMINIVIVAPSVMLLFDGDESRFYNDMGYGDPTYVFEDKALTQKANIDQLVMLTDSTWKEFDIHEVHIHNYADQGMHVVVSGELDHREKFTAPGEIVYKASTSEVVYQKDPAAATSYLDGVKGAMYHLHFGDYGGYVVKCISFAMGLATCFVIITGILIWLEARNRKGVPEKEKRFNERVGNIYLSICLTMFPVTALSFIFIQVLPDQYEEVQQTVLYSFYFITWLLSSIFFVVKKDNYFTNKCTLLIGATIGIVIPIVNGIVTGNWLWYSLSSGQRDIFVVDVLWISLSAIAFYTIAKLKRKSVHQDEDNNKVASSIETREAVVAE